MPSSLIKKRNLNIRWYVLALLLGMPFSMASAKCFSNSIAEHPCRYIDGDSWCASHKNEEPYAYSDKCLEDTELTAQKSFPNKSGIRELRQGMDYSQAREIILNSGWQGVYTRWQDISEYGQDNKIYHGNGWREVVSCAGTGVAPCRFEFNDIDQNTLIVITEGECLTDKQEYPEEGESCDVGVSRWFLE